MSIKELIQRQRPSKAGAWRVESRYDSDQRNLVLFHYETPMIMWNPDNPADHSTSLGYGSVSDQNGVNTFYKVFNLPYRYSRDKRGGGPRIDAF